MFSCRMIVRRIAAASVLLAMLLSLPAEASPWRDDRPVTVGHRGTTLLADENTMAAFEIARQHGVDIIECDPRMTRDGVYVIMHDADVSRTTDGAGKVRDMTLAEVKKLRTRSGHRVPTLRQVLSFARRHNMGVYLDVKRPPRDRAETLVQDIEDTGMTDMVIVGCYHVLTCVWVEKLNPRISICVSWPYPALTLGEARLLGADAVGTLTEFATGPMIKLAHKYELRVITMPVNDKQMLLKLSEDGVDALQSDDPRLLSPYGRSTPE
ncbi:MAG: glycerophosphodiester phosphodiesterase family protein [bacterium]